MYQFNYHRPATLADAEKLFSGADDPKFLGGGQTLIPTLKQRLASPSDIIDLAAIRDLAGITVTPDALTIGAATRHADVAASADVRSAIPALADLAGWIGDPLVRHRGTIGGSIANADPSADYPAAAVALNATIHTTKRTIAADGFFTGMFETALQPGEIITKIAFPVAEKTAYEKFRNPASRYAVVGVFVAKTASGVRVAVTGAAPSVFRQTEMEAALSKSFTPDAVAGINVSADGLNADLHATAEYRAHLVTVMAKRAVARALG
ncbi:MAG: xanthine dehydrogenase family protein subunit M [Micropepsaceae bacterium]